MSAKVGLFISYNQRYRSVASALKTSLTAISEQIDVWIDHAKLEPGQEYDTKLAQAISNSEWFVMICAGRLAEQDLSWCYYEAGQFRAHIERSAAPAPSDTLRRMCCLFDEEQPRQLKQYLGTRIIPQNRNGRPMKLNSTSEDQASYEDTDLFDFFSDILTKSRTEPLRDVGNNAVRTLIREQVRQVTNAFVESQRDTKLRDIPLQPRVDFLLPPSSSEHPVTLSDETVINASDNTLGQLFNIAGNKTTWGEIKKISKLRNGADPLWLVDVEEAVLEVSKDLIPRQPESLLRSKKQFYRPLVPRYEPFKSGARICYLAFVPSRSRQFELENTTSFLLAALALSIRFRQKVLPLRDALASADSTTTIDKVERELTELETEALEYGFPDESEPDDQAGSDFSKLFCEDERASFFRKEGLEWRRRRQRVLDLLQRSRTDRQLRGDLLRDVREMVEYGATVNSIAIRYLCIELMESEGISADSLKSRVTAA